MESQRDAWIRALREHEREAALLSRALARLPAAPGQADSQSVFLAAQLTRHRIGIALLAARLAAA
jgi:hypothetical protein